MPCVVQVKSLCWTGYDPVPQGSWLPNGQIILRSYFAGCLVHGQNSNGEPYHKSLTPEVSAAACPADIENSVPLPSAGADSSARQEALKEHEGEQQHTDGHFRET